MARQHPLPSAGSDEYELFLSLFTKCQGRMQAYIRTLVHDPAQADDVFQSTSLALWRSFATFRRDAEFLPWAIGTARHQVLVHWRSQRRDRHVFSEALLADLADTAEVAVETAEARLAALEACIAALSDRQRELIRLFYGENQAADAIASHWGRTVHAVYKALKVMRKALLDCVTTKLSSLIDPSSDGFEGRPAVS
jgi:RNA polymerase sigma-70 factor (ECF subfamily)